MILGEKGLGRLSAMRLGDYMEVITPGKPVTAEWNQSRSSTGTVSLKPLTRISAASPSSQSPTVRRRGRQKGTLIEIHALSSEWSFDKLESLARDHFSKLVDPFSAETLPLEMSFNGNEVTLPSFRFLHPRARTRDAGS